MENNKRIVIDTPAVLITEERYQRRCGSTKLFTKEMVDIITKESKQGRGSKQYRKKSTKEKQVRPDEIFGSGDRIITVHRKF